MTTGIDKKSAQPIAPARQFSDVIAPMDGADFLTHWWGMKLLHLRGPEGRFANLLPWAALTTLLETQRFPQDSLRLVQGGKPLEVERFAQRCSGAEPLVLKSAALSRCLADGATLVMDHVQERVPALRQLADAVGNDLRANTTINLYASFGAQEGFGLHWDGQENFILQIAGRKHWKVYRPTRVNPLKGEINAAPSPSGEPDWEGVIEDGDMLYLPRGWWHIARPLDGPSLHLTLTVEPPLGAHLLEWLVAELREHPVARMNLPLWASAREQADYVEDLLAAVGNISRDTLVPRFLAAQDASTIISPRLPLPLAASARPPTLHAASRLRLAVGRGLAISTLDDPAHVAVWAGDRHWRSPTEIAPALLALRAAATSRLADLDALLTVPGSAKSLRVFLGVLILAGIVDVE
ncbi:MAG: JmjC domain-containing protein [Pseudomarimonas sp.]